MVKQNQLFKPFVMCTSIFIQTNGKFNRKKTENNVWLFVEIVAIADSV